MKWIKWIDLLEFPPQNMKTLMVFDIRAGVDWWVDWLIQLQIYLKSCQNWNMFQKRSLYSIDTTQLVQCLVNIYCKTFWRFWVFVTFQCVCVCLRVCLYLFEHNIHHELSLSDYFRNFGHKSGYTEMQMMMASPAVYKRSYFFSVSKFWLINSDFRWNKIKEKDMVLCSSYNPKKT